MDSAGSGAKNLSERPVLTIQVGNFRLTGWRAATLLAAILGALAGAFLTRKSPKTDIHRIWMNNWPMLLSLGLWVFFSACWSAAAKNSAAAKSSESAKSTLLHQLLLNVALLLLFIPVPGLERPFLPPARYFIPIGLAVQAAFMLLAFWARRHLGRNWSAEVRVAAGHELVRTGPYRLVRHPIYSAMFGMFLGTAIVSGGLHALAAVCLLAVAYWRKIRLEEHGLSEEFGPAYREYQDKSWALVPWLL